MLWRGISRKNIFKRHRKINSSQLLSFISHNNWRNKKYGLQEDLLGVALSVSQRHIHTYGRTKGDVISSVVLPLCISVPIFFIRASHLSSKTYLTYKHMPHYRHCHDTPQHSHTYTHTPPRAHTYAHTPPRTRCDC